MEYVQLFYGVRAKPVLQMGYHVVWSLAMAIFKGCAVVSREKECLPTFHLSIIIWIYISYIRSGCVGHGRVDQLVRALS